jgi:O-antigen ligase
MSNQQSSIDAKLASALAYLGLYTVLAGDSLRYSVGWFGWGVVAGVIAIATVYLLIKNRLNWRRVPPLLLALLALMALSTLWSNYQSFTALATLSQLLTTAFGLMLATEFSWQRLLRILANTVRTILLASFVFELIAAIVVQGPIPPIFKNYTGDTPPSGAFYWTQAHLLTGQRIQGIVGNSNILAFIAMLGLLLFAIEFVSKSVGRKLAVSSLALAAITLALAKSAGVGFAIAAVVISVSVAWLVRGKNKDERHRLYRFAWTGAGVLMFFVLLYRNEVFQFIGKSPDMSGRAGIWQAVFGLIQLRPIQGWGWISYWVPGLVPYENLAVVNGVPYYQAHNAYLDTWMQLGIFGLMLLLALIAVTFVRLWRVAVRSNDLTQLWPIMVFVGIVVQNLTESRLLLESGWVLLVLLASKARISPIEELE